MEIIDFYYDDLDQILEVTFSTDSEGDYYRSITLPLEKIKFYYPTHIDEDDIIDCDDEFVLEILEEYFKNNDMPEEEIL